MRQRPSGIDEQRPVLILFDELESFINDDIVRILAALATGIARQWNLFTVTDEMVRKVVVSVNLVVVAEPNIEAMSFWHAGRAWIAKAPFAKAASRIARFL